MSIIIPVYNAARFLSECILSIENQTYKQLEVVFVNDCSTDDSLDLLHRFSKSLDTSCVILNNEKNGGAAFSRNVGLKAASGDYVFFMDADDTISTNCIQLLAESATKNKFPDIVLSNVDAPNCYYKRIDHPKLIEGNKAVRESYFAHEWFEMPWNKLIRKNFLMNNSIFFSPPVYYEDSLWSFETALFANQILLLPDETYHYRKWENQKTARKEMKQHVKDVLCLYQAMYRKIDGIDSSLYVTNIAQGWMFSQIVQKESWAIGAYKVLRELCPRRIVFYAIFSSYISLGMKVMLLYRLMPYTMGIKYLKFYASNVAKR